MSNFGNTADVILVAGVQTSLVGVKSIQSHGEYPFYASASDFSETNTGIRFAGDSDSIVFFDKEGEDINVMSRNRLKLVVVT